MPFEYHNRDTEIRHRYLAAPAAPVTFASVRLQGAEHEVYGTIAFDAQSVAQNVSSADLASILAMFPHLKVVEYELAEGGE